MSALEIFSVRGKIIVLTGGSGLYGRGLAAMLAEAGATLVIASRGLEKLQQVAAEETARGFTVHAEQLDQSDEKSVLALRDRVFAQFGRVDGLVNNSVARPMKSPADPVSAWEESMRVNATGLFLVTRAFGEAMCGSKS